MNGSFSSNSDGSWSASNPIPGDMGTNGIWSTLNATTVPEPSSLLVVILALASMMLVAARQRRSFGR